MKYVDINFSPCAVFPGSLLIAPTRGEMAWFS